MSATALSQRAAARPGSGSRFGGSSPAGSPTAAGGGGGGAGSPGSPGTDISLTNSMLEEKVNRKRAEVDLQLLANRIALLRAEEQRALTKVSETKDRAKEIIEIKRRNELALNEKMAKNISRETAIREAQQKANMEREARKMRIANSKKVVEDSKKAMAAEKKQEAQKQLSKLEQQNARLEEEKRLKALEEKRRLVLLRQQKEKERADHERALQAETQARLREESKRRQEAEALIDVLEREEKDLIARLRQTQLLQAKAFSALQASLES